jgi:RNA methyltransferase, TrmH family
MYVRFSVSAVTPWPVAMKTISSRQNPIVRAHRALAGEPDPAGARLLLDGVHLVRDARTAGLTFESVAIAASRVAAPTEEGDVARALEAAGTPVVTVSDAVFEVMSPVRSPSGLIAIARRSPSDISAICNTTRGFTLVAVDVQDPGNLGALIRAAEAGGVTGMVVAGTSAHPFSWKALRGSMGSALRLPLASARDVDAVVKRLRAAGTKTVASVPRGGRAPDDMRWKGAVALFLGGEGPGLSANVVSQCDDHVTVPMAPGVESLNVAVAGGILIYAARRQRV